MIPLVAVVSLRGRESRTLRVWVPLILLWLLLVPLAVLLSPVIFIVCLVCRVNPFRAFSVGWQILRALNDTEVEIEHRSAGVSICVF
ncbi:MAG: hypothetical protein ABR880_19805 [Candidatus Sulfotelmatobacter sp.]|jgi:hypothetical protein